MSSTVKYKLDEAVAVVTLNRPDAMNSFNTDLRATVVRYFQQARDDAAVRAIVFTGEGRCFSAGADLKAGIDPDVEKTPAVGVSTATGDHRVDFETRYRCRAGLGSRHRSFDRAAVRSIDHG